MLVKYVLLLNKDFVYRYSDSSSREIIVVAFRHPPVFESLGRPRGPYLCVEVLKARDWLCFLPPHKTVGHHSPRAIFLGTYLLTEGVSQVSRFRRRWVRASHHNLAQSTGFLLEGSVVLS